MGGAFCRPPGPGQAGAGPTPTSDDEPSAPAVQMGTLVTPAAQSAPGVVTAAVGAPVQSPLAKVCLIVTTAALAVPVSAISAITSATRAMAARGEARKWQICNVKALSEQGAAAGARFGPQGSGVVISQRFAQGTRTRVTPSRNTTEGFKFALLYVCVRCTHLLPACAR